MISDWQFAVLLVITVIGFGALLYVSGQIKTHLEYLVRTIQWGSPRIQERQPRVPAPANHRKQDD